MEIIARNGTQQMFSDVGDGIRTGDGSFTFHDGRKFEGNYENNQPNGAGLLTFVNGTTYSGHFKNGKFHGSGKMIADDGQGRSTV